MVSTNFLAHETFGKYFYFLKIFISRNIFEKGDFCQFLSSKIYDKIWHCFNIFCNFCVSENFGTLDFLIIHNNGTAHLFMCYENYAFRSSVTCDTK